MLVLRQIKITPEVPMTDQTENKIGDIIKAARKEKRLSLRKVEDLSRELAERDPTTYEHITKSTIWEMEEYGMTFFAHRNTSPGKVRALIHLLWDGDTEKFMQETGIEVSPFTATAAPIPIGIPHYMELEYTANHRTTWNRTHTPENWLKADFVVEVRTSRMNPVAVNGQMLYCSKNMPKRGEMAIIERENLGIVIAWCTGPNQFKFTRPLQGDPEEFAANLRDQILGTVVYTKPIWVDL